jgi:hypothetical protein
VDNRRIGVVLRQIRAAEPCVVGHSDLIPPMVLKSEVKPAVDWSASEIESALDVTLPDEMAALWAQASEIRLLSDVNYGQWGCILWSPAEIAARHHTALGWRGRDNFRRGDLVVGEFRGDLELLVLRCDPSQDDFGDVLVAAELDPRAEWPTVASSIVDFMTRFLSRCDGKYWEAPRVEISKH